jgi:hypothetical protein
VVVVKVNILIVIKFLLVVYLVMLGKKNFVPCFLNMGNLLIV